MDNLELKQCPVCEGSETVIATGIRYSPDFQGSRQPAITMPCFGCKGEGKVSPAKLALMERGESWHAYRVNTLGLTLREAASLWGMKPSELSRLEQGEVDTDWSPPGYVPGG